VPRRTAAREASELAERFGDLDLQSHAWGARGTVAFAESDFASALTWSQRRLDVKDRISDPDHVADIYELAIPSYCANGISSRARARSSR